MQSGAVPLPKALKPIEILFSLWFYLKAGMLN
jgi:hypothetical protein